MVLAALPSPPPDILTTLPVTFYLLEQYILSPLMELIQGLETYRGTKAVEGDCYVILPSMFYLHLPPPGSKSLGLTSRRDENKGLFYLAAALYQLPTVIAVNKILVLSHGGRALFSYFFRDTCPPPCICPPVPSPDTSNAF